MALAIHVIAQKDTDVVLAACTLGEGKDPAELLAELVGDQLPLRVADVTPPKFIDLAAVKASQVVAERVPGDPIVDQSLNVLRAPMEFAIKRDAQGKVQGLDRVNAMTFTSMDAGGVLNVAFPSSIEISGRAGWIRLIDGAGKAFDAPVKVNPKSNTDLNHGTATVTVVPGTYTMMALVQGFAVLVKTGVVVT